MKQLVTTAILKFAGKVSLFTAFIAVVICITGYFKKWDTSVAYSNSFFMAGSLAVIAGGLSKMGAGQEWSIFQLLYAESFRGMSSHERANFIINISSSVGLLTLGALSGILLILISLLIAKLF